MIVQEDKIMKEFRQLQYYIDRQREDKGRGLNEESLRAIIFQFVTGKNPKVIEVVKEEVKDADGNITYKPKLKDGKPVYKESFVFDPQDKRLKNEPLIYVDESGKKVELGLGLSSTKNVPIPSRNEIVRISKKQTPKGYKRPPVTLVYTIKNEGTEVIHRLDIVKNLTADESYVDKFFTVAIDTKKKYNALTPLTIKVNGSSEKDLRDIPPLRPSLTPKPSRVFGGGGGSGGSGGGGGGGGSGGNGGGGAIIKNRKVGLKKAFKIGAVVLASLAVLLTSGHFIGKAIKDKIDSNNFDQKQAELIKEGDNNIDNFVPEEGEFIVDQDGNVIVGPVTPTNPDHGSNNDPTGGITEEDELPPQVPSQSEDEVPVVETPSEDEEQSQSSSLSNETKVENEEDKLPGAPKKSKTESSYEFELFQ